MLEVSPTLRRITATLSKAIYRMELHCIIYFALLFICQAQIIECLASENSIIFSIFKWFDCSNYIQPTTLLYFMTTTCIILTLTLFVWMFQLWPMPQIETNAFFHTVIKISIISTFAISYLFVLSLIKCTVLLSSSDNNIDRILAIITFSIFLVFLYPLSTILMTQLSSHGNKTVAYFSFPNNFTFLNLYRLIIAIFVAAELKYYVIIPTVVFFILFIVFLARSPIITWKYNKISQIFFALLLWNIIWYFVQIASQTDISIYMYFIGGTAFAFSILWILQKRVISIITNQKGSKLKLRVLYFLIVNIESYEKVLAIMLFEHYKNCQSFECFCHKLLEFYRTYQPVNKIQNRDNTSKLNQKRNALKNTFSTILKLKQSKRTGRKIQIIDGKQTIVDDDKQKKSEQNLWLQFLCQLQNEHINTDHILEMPVQQRQKYLTEGRQILLDQAEILHYLNKHYQSLKFTWMVQQSKFSVFSLLFLVRLLTQMHRQEKTIDKKAKGQGCNIYALNYYDLQLKLCKFQQILLKFWNRAHGFFVELSCDRPNQTKITYFIKEMIKSRKQLNSQCLKYQKSLDKKTSNSYQSIWKHKVCKVMNEIYEPFSHLMQLKSIKIPQLTQEVEQSKILEKDIKFYSSNSKTGVCIAGIQEGPEFGKISNTNKQFWEILDTSRYNSPCINDFLVEEMGKHHTNLMKSFLTKNTCFLNLTKGFMLSSKKQIIEVQFSLHMLPIINDQLYFVFFMQPTPNRQAILLVDQMSNIISVNQTFRKKFLQENTLQDFNKQLTKQIVEQVKINNEFQLTVNEKNYLLTPYRTIEIGIQQSLSYFFVQQAQGNSILQSRIETQQKQQQVQPCVNIIPPTSKQPSEKQKREQQVKQKKANNLFNFLQNLSFQEKSFKLVVWKTISYVILFCIIVFSLTCAGLIQFRITLFMSANSTFQNLTNYVQYTTQVSHLARKVNIESFNRVDNKSIAEKMIRMDALGKLMAQERKFFSNSWWERQAQSFQLSRDGKQTKQLLTFQMIMSKCLLAGISTYTGSKIGQFDYIVSNNPLPLSNQITAMYEIIYNAFYIILPDIVSQLRDQVVKDQNTIVSQPVPIIPIVLSVVFLCLILQSFTIVLRIKLINLFHQASLCLKKLKLAQIQQKINGLNMYKDTWLKDTFLSKIQKNSSSISPRTQSQYRHSSQLDSQFDRENGDETPKQIILTSRTDETSRGESRIVPTLPHHKIKLEVSIPDKKIPVIKIILQLIIIIILALLVFVVQFTENKHVWNSLVLRNFYNQKVENIKIANSYSFQFGYENTEFKSQNYSIYSQMAPILQKIYEIDRSIQQTQAIVSADYVIRMKELNTMSVCQSLQLAVDLLQVQPCTQQQWSLYASKTKKQMLTQFVQSTRSLFMDFNKLNLTVEDQRTFAADERHAKLSKQQQKLINIQNYISKQFQKSLQEHIYYYQLKIVLTCVILAVVIILIGLYWVPMQFKQFQRELDKIKLTYQLIILIGGTKDDGPLGAILENYNSLECFS